mmetsp:Transcript_149141/g.479026  ORF Transcript_149141/g.479026 Transcript_149141/m.479026 type:complete len:267 (-) Transcript_149141:3-803(-)
MVFLVRGAPWEREGHNELFVFEVHLALVPRHPLREERDEHGGVALIPLSLDGLASGDGQPALLSGIGRRRCCGRGRGGLGCRLGLHGRHRRHRSRGRNRRCWSRGLRSLGHHTTQWKSRAAELGITLPEPERPGSLRAGVGTRGLLKRKLCILVVTHIEKGDAPSMQSHVAFGLESERGCNIIQRLCELPELQVSRSPGRPVLGAILQSHRASKVLQRLLIVLVEEVHVATPVERRSVHPHPPGRHNTDGRAMGVGGWGGGAPETA